VKVPQLGNCDEASHIEDFTIDPHFALIAEFFAFYNSISHCDNVFKLPRQGSNIKTFWEANDG
jgi:hypothetical protein